PHRREPTSFPHVLFTPALHPIAALFPYTTLFRSAEKRPGHPRSPATPHHAGRPRERDEPAPPPSPVTPPTPAGGARARRPRSRADRKSTRLNSSHVKISYAVFCLKKKKNNRGAAT